MRAKFACINCFESPGFCYTDEGMKCIKCKQVAVAGSYPASSPLISPGQQLDITELDRIWRLV